jgi:NADH-quinone oxidoreductase subunit K
MPLQDVFTIDVLRNYLLVGGALFVLGMLGFLARRNMIVMFLSVEMMLQGVALSLVGFGRYHGTWTGQVFTILMLTVAACEASIALALIVILYNQRSSLDVTLWREIREDGVP